MASYNAIPLANPDRGREVYSKAPAPDGPVGNYLPFTKIAFMTT